MSNTTIGRSIVEKIPTPTLQLEIITIERTQSTIKCLKQCVTDRSFFLCSLASVPGPFFLAVNLGVLGEWVCQLTGINV